MSSILLGYPTHGEGEEAKGYYLFHAARLETGCMKVSIINHKVDMENNSSEWDPWTEKWREEKGVWSILKKKKKFNILHMEMPILCRYDLNLVIIMINVKIKQSWYDYFQAMFTYNTRIEYHYIPLPQRKIGPYSRDL